MRIAVIGDIGGHLDQLCAELARLGVDLASGLPKDLVVIQVGDLVHRGPASDEVISLVDQLMLANPGRWIQLVGNHESVYLGHPAFIWPDRLRARSVRTLRRWWKEGRAVAAAAVETADDSYLVTHAGVTAAFWADQIGAPVSVRDAANRINELAAANDHTLFRPGYLVTGRVNPHVGPLWADTARELVPSWLDRQMPFNQIHGHTTMVDWRQRGLPPESSMSAVVSVDAVAKHETVWIEGRRLIGVDPGHREKPVTPWRAIILDGVAFPSQ
jgi:hypothetical protein